MKIKELKRAVNVCWSPAEQYPAMLAAGSAAQQVDSSFSSNSSLEIYALNLGDPGYELELKSSLSTQHRFQKIVWSGAGVLVGGCDGGLLQFYSTERLLKNAGDALLGTSTKHSGHVSALDINPYQKNLVASGASDSEIFIWDLNNTSQPMAPGNRSTPQDYVQGLAWNQQVQHILASSFATRCVVWDLRKNEPIMKLSDSVSRSRWRALGWHPGVATQLCLASEDDLAPVVQLWDLRLAASPLVTLEGHSKGVMSVSWSRHDPDLLLSAGKDGAVLCWNPNNTKPGGELLVEISRQPQWVFDVSWSPREPGLLVAASFDQQVTVHSLLGGSKPTMSAGATSNIMDSFGGVDSFSQLPAVSAAPAAPAPPAPRLPRAPRWLKRPAAAKFAFGGKLVTFEKNSQENDQHKLVYISQVVSDPELVEQSAELDAVLDASLSQEPGATDRLAEYCRLRGETTTDQNERYTWYFLRANFMPTFRSEVLNLLGFKQDEIPSKFKGSSAVAGDLQTNDAALSRGESTETEAELSTDTSTDLSEATTLIERKLANVDLGPTINNITIPNGDDPASLVCRALVCGNLEEAVELCLEANRIPDAMIIASLGSQELLYKVQKYHLNKSAQDPVALVGGSLLQSQWERLVRGAAPASWRHSLAALVTHTDGEALAHYAEMLGDKLSAESDPSVSAAAELCYLCGGGVNALAARWARAHPLLRRTELALLARRAAALRGRQLNASGKLEALLTEYAFRLSAQGCLQSALASLQAAGDSRLRERLQFALGLVQQRNTQPNHQMSSRTRTTSGHAQPRGRHSDVSNSYSAVPPQQFAPAPAPAPTPNRPSSVGPPAAGGITSRSKYKVDPSVQAAPLYNQYGFNNPSTQQFAGYNSPLPDQYGSVSNHNYNQPAINTTPYPPAPINPNTLNPSAQINPQLHSNLPGQNPNPQFNPLNPSIKPLNPQVNQLNPPLNHLNPPVNQLNPSVNGGYYQTPQQIEAPAPTKPAPAGWNDPPMLSSKSRPKQEVQTPAPITHPLFGVEAPQHVPLNPAGYPGQFPGQQQQGQYPGQFPAQQEQFPGQQGQFLAQQAQFPGQEGQFPGQQYQEQQYQGQYPSGLQQGYSQQSDRVAAAVEAVPVVKAPLPPEYAPLQAALDALRDECCSRAHNPQMKRKLEDVQRRLETLYDMLREHKLSESAVASLHSCAQLARSSDFASCLGVCAALATTTDFAAVASFLPGLKSLFQMAAQLQVQLR